LLQCVRQDLRVNSENHSKHQTYGALEIPLPLYRDCIDSRVNLCLFLRGEDNLARSKILESAFGMAIGDISERKGYTVYKAGRMYRRISGKLTA
jgi:hypothetical protein